MLKKHQHIEPLGIAVLDNQGNLSFPPKTTIVEARKLLGRKYSHLTDTQVQEIVVTLTLLARNTLKL